MPTSDVAPGPERPPRRSRSLWWTRKAVTLHATIVVVVPVFAGLFWWQVQRVRQGNTLSWAYVFEWPFFTGYAVYMWWRLVHDQSDPGTDRPRAVGADDGVEGGGGVERSGIGVERSVGGGESVGVERSVGVESGGDENRVETEEDEELAAYNRYLAELHTSGRRKRW